MLRSAVTEKINKKELFLVEKAPEITISTYMVHVDEPERQGVLSKAIEGLRAIKEVQS